MGLTMEDFIVGLRQMGLSAVEIAREVLRVTRVGNEMDSDSDSGGNESDYPDADVDGE